MSRRATNGLKAPTADTSSRSRAARSSAPAEDLAIVAVMPRLSGRTRSSLRARSHPSA